MHRLQLLFRLYFIFYKHFYFYEYLFLLLAVNISYFSILIIIYKLFFLIFRYNRT